MVAPSTATEILLFLAALMLLGAAGSDARAYRIPNAISLGLIVLFPLYFFVSPTEQGFLDHITASLIVLAIGWALYTKGLAGAGDIKLLAATSLWAGPEHIGAYLFITAIAGGFLSLIVACLVAWQRRKEKEGKLEAVRKTRVPYGVAIALGGLCVLAMLLPPATT